MGVPVATGFVKTPGRRRVVVQFDSETFAEIRGLAETDHTSFAEQIRTLVEWGLDARRQLRPARRGNRRAAA